MEPPRSFRGTLRRRHGALAFGFAGENIVTNRMLRPKRWQWQPAAVALASLVLLAACGENPIDRRRSERGGIARPQPLAFANCVRAHGVPNFPDPNGSGQFNKVALQQLATSNSRYATATHACQHLLPAPSPAQQRRGVAHALLFSHCMRAHGVTNFPDPGSDGRIPASHVGNRSGFATLREARTRPVEVTGPPTCRRTPPTTPTRGRRLHEPMVGGAVHRACAAEDPSPTRSPARKTARIASSRGGRPTTGRNVTAVIARSASW